MEDMAVRSDVSAVATAMLPELPSIGIGCTEHIAAFQPEFAETGSSELLRTSCRSNSAALLDGLIRGVRVEAMPPSVEVIQTTRAFVQNGLTLASVMRGYRLGIAYWCDRWADGVARHTRDAQRAAATVGAGTRFLLSWLELVTAQLSVEAQDEAERIARTGALARLEEVRRVLTGTVRDVQATSLRLGYDLEGTHRAFVLRHDGDGETLARRLSPESAPLVVSVDIATTWCWVPHGTAPPAPLPGTVTAHSRLEHGLDGFRRSHADALEAMRMATLGRRGPGTVTAFADVELAAVCSGDPDRCRAFVLAELAGLAADDSTTRRLRATLEAFFDCDSNFRATAKRLGVHHNTVRYRLEQAEALLGRPPAERRLALELALHIAGRLSVLPRRAGSALPM